MKDEKGYRPLSWKELEQCRIDSCKSRDWTTAEARLYEKAADKEDRKESGEKIGLMRKTKKRSVNPEAVARRKQKNEDRLGKRQTPARPTTTATKSWADFEDSDEEGFPAAKAAAVLAARKEEESEAELEAKEEVKKHATAIS